MNKIRFPHFISLIILVAVFYSVSPAGAYSPNDQEVITTTDPKGQTVSLIVPRRAIEPAQVAVIANLQDAQSVNVAQYYSQVRKIPSQNTIYLNFKPGRIKIRATEFNQLKQQVDDAVAKLPDIQAYVITWTEPWGVLKDTSNEGMSINTAFSMGFDNYFNTQQVGCFPEKFDTFDSTSYRPYSDFKVRPTMMLAGTSFSNVKDLIDRGKSSDQSFPTGTGYFIRTTDGTRSGVRYRNFIETVDAWNRPDGIAMSYVDNSSGKGSNYLMNKTDILFYLTGLTTVPQINTNTYLPGAVADHLTSYGGILTGPSSQMSSLRWLEAGATGSYGTMMEPYAVEERFPIASILTQHYITGETLLESYWKSVAKPDLGVFIGDPLARPYGTKIKVDGSGKLNIATSILSPNRRYSLWSADNMNGPFKLVQQGITVDHFTIKEIQAPATSMVYLLQEDKKMSDPNLPLALTDDGQSEAHLVMKGDFVAWNVLNRSSSTIFVKNLKTGVLSRIEAPGDNISELRLDGNMLAYKANSCQSKQEVIRIVDITRGQITKTIFSYTFGYIRKILFENNKVYWVNLRDGISVYDLSKDVLKLIVSTSYILYADIDGNNLVWFEYQPYPGLIKTMDLVTGNQTQIATSYPIKDLRIKGKNLYWIYSDVGPRAVVSYDLVTHQTQTIFNVVDIRNATFEASKKWVVLKDDKTGQGNSGLYAYNIDSKKSQQVDLGNMVLTSKYRYISYSYSVALYDDKVAWTTNSSLNGHDDVYIKSLVPDLVAHWDMDETSGSLAYDSTLNANHAKLMNGPIWAAGKVHGGLSFDGIDDYLKVENSPTLELGKNKSNFSIVFWMNLKQNATGTFRSIFAKGADSNTSAPSIGMLPSENRINYCVMTNDPQPNKCIGSMKPLELATWVHLAIVKAGSELQLYINGNMDSRATFTGDVIPSSSPIMIGKANVLMDNIRVYSRALTADEIQSLIDMDGGIAPYIISQPINKTVTVGNSATFSVNANSSDPLKYQWRKNGINIQGATNSSYTTAPVALQDNGAKFSVVVTNDKGSVVSKDAILTVTENIPAIVNSPANQSLYAGQSVTFKVVAKSPSPMTYLWKKNGKVIAGAAQDTYSETINILDNGAKYNVTVSNAFGSKVSADATLTVKDGRPIIVTQPKSQTVSSGQKITLNVVANSTDAMTYQWRKNGLDLAGATTNTLTVQNAFIFEKSAKYAVRVSNKYGSVMSADALITFSVTPPKILVQPVSQTATVGQKVTFNVVVDGADPMFYLWIRNNTLMIGKSFQSPSYTTPALTLNDNAVKYRVFVFGMGGVAISQDAVLSVKGLTASNTSSARN